MTSSDIFLRHLSKFQKRSKTLHPTAWGWIYPERLKREPTLLNTESPNSHGHPYRLNMQSRRRGLLPAPPMGGLLVDLEDCTASTRSKSTWLRRSAKIARGKIQRVQQDDILAANAPHWWNITLFTLLWDVIESIIANSREQLNHMENWGVPEVCTLERNIR